MRKAMPIQVSGQMRQRVDRGERIVRVESIPWDMIADADKQSRENHSGQSVERIADRGGFDATEALWVMARLPYGADLNTEEAAHRVLYAMRMLFERGQRIAEKRAAEERDQEDRHG